MSETYIAVFVGGARHGEVEERAGEPPLEIRFPTYNGLTMENGQVVYRRRELADTPGRIAYTYEPNSELKCGAHGGKTR